MPKENYMAPGPTQAEFNAANDKITALRNLARSDDANALHTNAGTNEFYRTVLSANATGSPNVSNAFYLEGYKISDNYGFQNAYDTTNGYEYTRKRWGSSTWSDWVSLNSKVANFVASNPAFYGVYPNGKNYNRDYFRITVPCWNPEEKTITVTNAYVYNASGAFNDIISAVTVSATTRSAFICEITFDATHAGKMLWIEYTIAS